MNGVMCFIDFYLAFSSIFKKGDRTFQKLMKAEYTPMLQKILAQFQGIAVIAA